MAAYHLGEMGCIMLTGHVDFALLDEWEAYLEDLTGEKDDESWEAFGMAEYETVECELVED